MRVPGLIWLSAAAAAWLHGHNGVNCSLRNCQWCQVAVFSPSLTVSHAEPVPNRPFRVIQRVKGWAFILTFILTFRDFGMPNSSEPLISLASYDV
jgi:hypothetical protein